MSVEPVIGSRSFDQKSTLGAEADTQTGSPTAKADSLAPSTLSTLVEVNEPSTTVWEGFFTQKKEEFARAISKLEKSRTENNWKALKDRLTPKLDAKADEQAMTIDDALGRVKTLDSFKREVLAFVERFSVKEGESRNWFKKQTDRLFRGAQKVNQFQAGISCAVQMDPMGSACLIWGLILIVIQFSCLYAESRAVLSRVLNILSEVNDILPNLEQVVKFYDGNADLRDILLSIFDDYLKLCIAAIKYSTKFDHGLHISRVSNKAEKELYHIQDEIKKGVNSFDRMTSHVDRQAAMETKETILSCMNKSAEASRQRDENIISSNTRIINLLMEGTLGGSREVQLPVQSLTMPRNNNFTGREAALADLHKLLISSNDGKNAPAACSLQGIGGMGKTEIALEFAYKYISHWEAGVFWVAADTNQETELLRTFCDIGSVLGIVSPDEFDERNVVKVNQWLQKTDKRWLIIFDGFMPSAEWRRNMERIWPFKANTSGCAILVTTQVEMPSKYVKEVIHIEPLVGDQGLRLLLKETELERVTESEKSTALEISDELGGSALFLNLARESRGTLELSLAQYLDQIRGSSNIPLASFDADDVSKDWRYAKAAHKALDLILQHVGTGPRDLLDMLALMHHDDISEFVLSGQQFVNSDEYRQYLENVHMLKRTGLVKVKTSVEQQPHRSYRIHRAIQVALLMELNGDMQRMDAAFKRATRHLRASYPEPSPLQIPSAVTSAALRLVLPHVLSMVTCFERASPKPKGNLELARVVIDVGGMDCYDRGLIKGSYRLNNAVKTILKAVEGPGADTLLSDALVVQGLCTDFMALNKRDEGLAVREQCLDIRRRWFQGIPKDQLTHDDKIRLYNCYTDLSCSLQQMNDFSGVMKLLVECHDRYQEWGTEQQEPFEYSKYYNQAAYVLLYENRNDEAVEYAEKAYELAELSSPRTNYPWLYKFDYANILWQHGEHKQEAYELLRSLINGHSEELSASYSEILSLGMEQNLGIMAYYLGDLDLAEEKLLGLRARTPQCEAWPKENVLRGNYYLSQVLKAKQADSREALDLERYAIEELAELLKKDTRGRAELYGGDYPMLFDYLVHWEFRLVTPRQSYQETGPQPQSGSWWWMCRVS